MIGAPPTLPERYDACADILRSVDEVARRLEDKWGFGRLPALVEPALAARLTRAREKFDVAWRGLDEAEAIKFGEALIRGYEKLDAVATEQGHEPSPPEQWEFEAADGTPIVLVRDSRDIGRAKRFGRRCQVWSLDEIENVIREFPVLSEAKDHFPGAEVISIRPGRPAKAPELVDDSDIPF